MEKIKCAAIKDCNGTIHQGYDHAECFKKMQKDGVTHIGAKQGFVTEGKERFVNRYEAFDIAEKAGQVIRKHGTKEMLFSEDLNGYPWKKGKNNE